MWGAARGSSAIYSAAGLGSLAWPDSPESGGGLWVPELCVGLPCKTPRLFPHPVTPTPPGLRMGPLSSQPENSSHPGAWG